MNPSSSFAPNAAEALSGLTFALPRIEVEHSLSGAAYHLVSSVMPAESYLLIADENTYSAIGRRVEGELQSHAQAESIILPRDIHAKFSQAQGLTQRLANADGIIAVGSGTINDLVKYAAFHAKKPYVSFPTAASMNGYLSSNASLIKDGLKQSFAAAMPVGVFCDCDMIARAPDRLTRAGLGDSLARSTAQIDWLFSHLLLGTDYKAGAFDLCTAYEPEMLAHAHLLDKKDSEAVASLMRVLLLTGLAMTSCNGSFPASQAEHMIAHTYEMLSGDHETYHGEQIGVTSMVMALHQQKLLQREEAPVLLSPVPKENSLEDVPSSLAAMIQKGTEEKKAFRKSHESLQKNLDKHWPGIRGVLLEASLPAEDIQTALERSQSAISPKQLGWNSRLFNQAYQLARFTRGRFTFLECE